MDNFEKNEVIALSPADESLIGALRAVDDASLIKGLRLEEAADRMAKSFVNSLSRLIGTEAEALVNTISIVENRIDLLANGHGLELLVFLGSNEEAGPGIAMRSADVHRFVQAVLSTKAPGKGDLGNPSQAEREVFAQLMHTCFKDWNYDEKLHKADQLGRKPEYLSELDNSTRKMLASCSFQFAQILVKIEFFAVEIELRCLLPVDAFRQRVSRQLPDENLLSIISWNAGLEFLAGEILIELNASIRDDDFPLVNLAGAKPGDVLKVFSMDQTVLVESEDSAIVGKAILVAGNGPLALQIFQS